MSKPALRRRKKTPKQIARFILSCAVVFSLLSYLAVGVITRVYPGVLGISSQIDPQEIVRLTNQQRVKNGLPPLRFSPILAAAAMNKGKNMFAENYWAHVSPSGKDPWYWIDKTGYVYTVAGENLAKDFLDPESVVSAWMASPTHRANILNEKYREIGVAVLRGTLKGFQTTLVVQMFATPKPQTKLGWKTSSLSPEEKPLPSPAVEVVPPKVEGKKIEKVSISPFYLLKVVSLCLVVLLLGILSVDVWAVWTGQIKGIGSHSLAHATLLVILLLAIVYTNVGVIV